MNALTATIRDRVARIRVTPAIPAVLIPLLKLFNVPAERADMNEIVRLVSYDNAIAAQCLRVAGSPLFGLARAPKSISGAVVTLGLNRVKSIVITCCMGQAFPAKKWPLAPAIFWKHSLGCAMVCRKFAEKLQNADTEKAYVAGLLHDVGFLVNCIAFPEQFDAALRRACKDHVALDEAEFSTMGFTHSQSGAILTQQWGLAEEIVEVVGYHHAEEYHGEARGLVAIVHLSDMLCRMRDLGYGYYENHKADLGHDSAWVTLMEKHRELENIDLARFTFELDEAVADIRDLVSMIFGSGPQEM
ncbi:MAG TPA: HDOD domain-containing protein [Candidatus Aquilonibacter sp.]|nr:HDOD domain-containing protein [Candidatus Aquilonibacter sp.]